ncbi:MAG TPA: lipocalin-like domain-containing protein [Baekduia sp.]
MALTTQQQTDLVGTWRLASATVAGGAGGERDLHGPDPTGFLVFTASGHFAVFVSRSDLPPFASGDRLDGTDAEHRAVVRGSLGLYGTYRVDGDGVFLDQHVLGSTFPNWTDLRRGREALTLMVAGDTLTERLRVGDARLTLVWERHAPATGGPAPGGPNRVASVWRMATCEARHGETVEQPFGPEPAGYLVFTEDGYFVDVLHRPDLPPFASGDRQTGTAAENAAVVRDSLGVFGRYGVDAAGDFLDETVLGCTFPNWVGLSRDRSEITETVTGRTMTEQLDAGGGVHITITFDRVD